MQLGREVGLGPSDIVLDWDPASHLQQKVAESPNFRPMSIVVTAGWIKMAHGMEVGLCPCHIVLDGDPSPQPKRAQHPLFSAHVCCSHGRPSQLLLSHCLNITSAMHCIGHENDIQSCRSIAQSVDSFAATHSQL